MNDLQPNAPPVSVTQAINGSQSTSQPVSPTPVTPITPPTIETYEFKWIAHLSSLIVILAAAAYLIGFVVVNSSLFDYGMVPYDFSQPRYVSAGLLYLAATVGLTSIVFLMVHLTRKKFYLHDKENAELKSAAIILFVVVTIGSELDWLLPKSENIAWWLQSLKYPSLALAAVVGVLNSTLLPIPKYLSGVNLWWRKHLWEEGWLSWIVLCLVLVSFLAKLGYAFAFYPVFLISIWYLFSGFRSNQSPEAAFKTITDGLVYGIMGLCLSVYVYAGLTYPLISPHVGGGKPLLVSLSLKPDHNHTIGRIMGREDWKCVMHNISLVHENSELIYVLPHGYYANESAIAIPKNELVSIAYQKKEKSEHSTCLE